MPGVRFSAEQRAKAVRLVVEATPQHASQWAAISSVAAKIGASPETVRKWVRRVEVDSGQRAGLTSGADHADIKRLKQALFPPLSEVLAPVVEHIASLIAGAASVEVRVPTVLTHDRHKAARSDPSKRPRRKPAGAQPADTLWACPDCGSPVTNDRHVRCGNCTAADPRQTAEARGRRGAAIAARKRAQAAWESDGGLADFDPAAWPTIQAGLAEVKLADIVAATGLSKSFASQVRAGRYRPHPSLWPTLGELGQEAAGQP